MIAKTISIENESVMNVFWHFVISNVDSLKVKYNLDNNVPNPHPHTMEYEVNVIGSINGECIQKMEVMRLVIVNMMLNMIARK